MKVKQLIKRLGKMDPDALVVVARDAEGNGFTPASTDFSVGKYHEGEFVTSLDEDEYELPKSAKAAICLWPLD